MVVPCVCDGGHCVCHTTPSRLVFVYRLVATMWCGTDVAAAASAAATLVMTDAGGVRIPDCNPRVLLFVSDVRRFGVAATAFGVPTKLLLRLISWHSGKTSVFGRRTCPVLRSTCSWWVTTYVGKQSAIGQPTRPTRHFIHTGSIDE